MNKFVFTVFLLFTISFLRAQENPKANAVTDPESIEYLKAEKQRLSENPSPNPSKFQHLQVMQNTGASNLQADTAPEDIQAKIDYLRSLNCCESKIQELESLLTEINN